MYKQKLIIFFPTTSSFTNQLMLADI